jgi:cell shape-determining protein MreD
MRWQVFIIFAFFAVVLDSSFMSVLQMNLPVVDTIAPSIVAMLAVFVCLFASRLSALASCLLLGVLVDLSLPAMTGGDGRDVYLLGPHALGMTFAGYLILQMRTMVFRQRALTVGVLTGVFVLTAGVVMLAIYVIRGWYGDGVVYLSQPSAFREFIKFGAVAIYSGVLAVPLGWMLLQTTPLWGFQMSHQRRMTR